VGIPAPELSKEWSLKLCFFGDIFGVPVSTIHVITGAIFGVGAARRISAVRWHVALRIVWAWLFTIPVAALFGGAVYLVINLL